MLSEKMRRLQKQDLEMIWHPCSQMKDYEQMPPIVVQSGKGVWLYDIDGNAYIDIVSSWWCNLLGHCNERIASAIKDQLNHLEHVIFANFTHEPAIRLCKELFETLPQTSDQPEDRERYKFNFSDNGSASVECALKMAFQYQRQTGHPEKTSFFCLADSYHGETVGALSVGSLDLYAEIYKPMLMDAVHIPGPDCYRCRFGGCRDTCQAECISFAERAFEREGESACAMIVEPLIQGSAGMKIYPPIYLKKLRSLCDRFNVLLIADEIMTGFGRTGTMFAMDQTGVIPDIFCFSKGLTGGFMPMSLTVTRQKIYDAFYADYHEGRAFMHSHTYSGNPLGCSAALAVLQVLKEENIIDLSRQRAAYLHQRLTKKLEGVTHIGEIRHKNLIHAIELSPRPDRKDSYPSEKRIGYQLYQRALKKGLLLRPLGDVLYFNPPLIINEREIDIAVETLFEVLTENASLLDS